jgi:hypothetical protein
MVKLFYYTQIELQCFNVIVFQPESRTFIFYRKKFSPCVSFMDTEIYDNIHEIVEQ